MMRALQTDVAPSYYFMHYEIVPPHPVLLPRGGEGVRRTVEGDLSSLGSGERNLAEPKVAQQPSEQARASQWIVRDLLLVPHFAFPPSAIVWLGRSVIVNVDT